MKRFLLFLIWVALAFTGCTTNFNDSGSGLKDAIFSVSENKVHFNSDGGDYVINVRSSSHWRAVCDASWIHMQNTTALQGEAPLKFTVTANSTTASRIGTIKVENSTYNLTLTIKITQDAFIPQLNPNESNIYFSTDEETRTITINSNIYWKATCDANWISLWNTVGSKGTSSLKFTVKANTITQTRTATIKITSTDYNITKEIEITQSNFVPELTFSEDKIEASFAEETRTVTVNSNAIWKASCDANWIYLWTTAGSNGTSTLKFTIRANNVATRTAAIKVTLEDYNITKEIQVTQLVPKLEISNTEISATAAGETKSIDITSNISWKATCEADWITLSPRSGSEGIHTLNIAIKANTLATDRTATVKISNAKYNITKEIKVSQGNFVPEIKLSTSSISADVSGGTKSIDITSNISWVATCDADWITLSPTSGSEGTSSIKLSIKANTLAADRTATVKISNSKYNITKEINVSQGKIAPEIKLSSSSISAGVSGETKSINITSNISWVATCDADWITLSPTSGSEGIHTLNIAIKANTLTVDRTATVKVSNSIYNITKEIKVSQGKFVPEINLSTSSISADVSGGTKSIDITSNISWEATCDADWITLSPTSGSEGTSSIKLSIKANTLAVDRTATVKISNSKYSTTKEIKVSQGKFTPEIKLSTSSISADVSGGTKSIDITSNISWKATCEADWITLSPTSGDKGTSSIKLTIKANTLTSKRTATVKIFNSDYNLTKEINVAQAEFVPTMTFSPSTVTATAEKSSKTITVVSNIAWTATCTTSWVSLKTTSGQKGTSTLQIDIEANPNITKRYTTIKFSSDQYNISFTLDVEQEQGQKQEQEQYNAIFYTSTDGKIVTPYYSNVFGANIVSNTYNDGKGVILFDAPVTSIGNNAFKNCSRLTSITIPNSVTSIGSYAFSDCGSLTSVTIPNSVTSIGDYAFSGCSSLTSVTISNSVTSIGYATFSGCSSLTNITIPNSVTSIGNYAFRHCNSLTSVTIGNSVTLIRDCAFFGCSSLTSITIPNSVTEIGGTAFRSCSSLKCFYGKYASSDNRCLIVDGVLKAFAPSGLTSYTIPNSVTSIGNDAFYGCSSLKNITIPNSVTSIGSDAFSDCGSLTSITIPNSVTSIGRYAFSNCSSLTSVTIPNSVTSIGEYVFYGCRELTNVSIGNSVTSIGEYAFLNCNGLTSVTIGNSVTSIGSYAFFDCSSLKSVYIFNLSAWCKIDFANSGANPLFNDAKLYLNNSELSQVTIPSDISKVKPYTFYNCSSLASITIPNSVTSIGEYAFYDCRSLTSVTIPNSVTSIGNNAFRHCSSLTSVTIGNSVTSIGDYAFSGCSSLTSVTIPNSVTSIGNNAFSTCKSLTSVTIPNSVTSIGEYAFYDCRKLTSVYCKPTTPPSGSLYMFDINASGRMIYVPKTSVDAYKAKAYWQNYADYIVGYNF